MSTLGMDDDLLYGPANTDLMDWPQGMMPEEVSQDPAPCSTTLTDKQEIELLREQVRALKEENQVLKLSYAKLLKAKTPSSANKNVSNSKLLVLVQQELEQKKILCENLAQKAGFYKTKYKSLKSTMFSQAMQQYNVSPSEEAVCTPDKPQRSVFPGRASAESLVDSKKKRANNLTGKPLVNVPRLLNLPSVSSDLSQEDSSSNLKQIVLDSQRQTPHLMHEDPQALICHLANMTNIETPSTSLADEEGLQARLRYTCKDSAKIVDLSHLLEATLGKREPKLIDEDEPINDVQESEPLQLQTRLEVYSAAIPIEVSQVADLQAIGPIATDSHMNIAGRQPKNDLQSSKPDSMVEENPELILAQIPSSQVPVEQLDPNPSNLIEPSVTHHLNQLSYSHLDPLTNNETTSTKTSPQKSQKNDIRPAAQKEPVLPKSLKKTNKEPPVRISHGTSDEEESSLESESLQLRIEPFGTEMEQNKTIAVQAQKKFDVEVFGHQSWQVSPGPGIPAPIGIFSLQTGPSHQQVTVGRLSKPSFLDNKESAPMLAIPPKLETKDTAPKGWAKVYATCWKLVETLQSVQNPSTESETKQQYVQLLNLFREMASKHVDAKAAYPPPGAATPLGMLLQPQLQEKQYSVKQVLSYQPESGESKQLSCQQFVVQTICYLVFISNYQDCSEVKALVQDSGILSAGLITDPLLQSKFLKLQEIVGSNQKRNSTSSSKTSSAHYGLLRVAFEHLVFVCERQIVPFNTQDLFMSNLLAQKASFNELRDAGHYAAEKAGRAGLSLPFYTDLEDLLAATRLLFHTMRNLGTGFQRTAHQTLRGFFSNRKYRNTAQQLVACLLLRQAAHANF